MDWIQFIQVRVQWWALVNMVMKLWIPWKVGKFLTNWVVISFQEGLCTMVLNYWVWIVIPFTFFITELLLTSCAHFKW